MTDPLYQHAVLVTDRSGSIVEILQGMQEGLQGFITALGQQLAPQGPLRKVTASLWDFDTEIACRHSMVPPAHLAGYVITPRGGTALHDAIGHAVTSEGVKLAALPEGERPGQVVVLIASDGRENSSREWSAPAVEALVTCQRDQYSWQFTFLGTNQDAIAEAGKAGIQRVASVTFDSSNAGAQAAYGVAASALRRYSGEVAMGMPSSFGYTEAERSATIKPEGEK